MKIVATNIIKRSKQTTIRITINQVLPEDDSELAPEATLIVLTLRARLLVLTY